MAFPHLEGGLVFYDRFEDFPTLATDQSYACARDTTTIYQFNLAKLTWFPQFYTSFIPITVTEPLRSTGGQVPDIAFGYTLKRTLTPDEIQNGNGSPILIDLPKSGPGFFYSVFYMYCRLRFVTTPYDSTHLYIGATTFAPSLWQRGIPILGVTGDITLPTVNFPNGTLIENSGYLENDTLSIFANQDSSNGDSPVDCYINVIRVAV